jgi:hypothetical protein
VAIGTRGERTVVERLPAHRDAVVLKVAVSPVEGGPTQVVDLQVDDANGVRVTCWSGSAQVSVKGPVTLRALTPAGEVEITRGRGRCFLTPSLESGSVEVEAQAESLRSGIACCEV